MTDHTRLERYNAKLIASGARLTPQRFMVLEVLATHTGHITADNVLMAVHQHYPHVNKTTVYRTLELLSELGLVTSTHLDGTAVKYELVDRRHHHLLCKRCGLNLELPDAAMDTLREPIAGEYGFQPCFDHFALFGVCRACQDRDTMS